jgi:hypothetical protein
LIFWPRLISHHSRFAAKSRLVLMMQPNDRHKATLPFTYDGYRRLRGPKLLFTGRFCGGLALFFTQSVQSIFLEVPDGSLLKVVRHHSQRGHSMRRVGFVWCSVLSIVVLFVKLLVYDFSQPRSDLLVMRLLENLEPKALAGFLALFALFCVWILAVAVLHSAWNRIAPHVLEGARAMTIAEAYAVTLILWFII